MFVYFLLLIGLVLLLVGGDWLVRGAVGLAERLGVPSLIIGLTIVSLGTSAPELFVSVNSAISGSDGIAIGNIVGSNIANVLMVLGIPAIFIAMKCNETGIGRSILVMIGVTVLFINMMQKGSLTRIDGFVLLVILGLFLFDQFRGARKARKRAEEKFDYHDEVENIPESMAQILAALAIGLVLLPLGAEFTVGSAEKIAITWGIPEEVIGLTIIAIGTSLPELATTVMAVRHGNSSIALGNIVGSNIFNIALIMGITSMIAPLEISDQLFGFDVWVMFGCTVLLGMFAFLRLDITRLYGLIMSGAFIAYISATVLYSS